MFEKSVEDYTFEMRKGYAIAVGGDDKEIFSPN
jgi:hypothetical protein